MVVSDNVIVEQLMSGEEELLTPVKLVAINILSMSANRDSVSLRSSFSKYDDR